MTPNFLKKIITAHYIWLESNGKSGQRANLYAADLKNADLKDADLNYANFARANLQNANFRGADLSHVNFYFANLMNANLRNTKLCFTDLRFANLSHVDLCGVNLRKTNLYKTNFTDAKNLPNPVDWMNSNFKKNDEGYVVFKRIKIGKTIHDPPDHWVIEENSYLTETIDKDRQKDCSHGINFGTREWCENRYTRADLWECLLEFDDLEKLVVPYGSDGKARCGRLKLIKITC